MELNEYQQHAKETAVYPEVIALEYLILGLVGEAGEIANKYKKVLRGDKTLKAARADLIDEASDTLWYLAMLCEELGVSFEDVARHNIAKLADRMQRQLIKGEGDNR